MSYANNVLAMHVKNGMQFSFEQILKGVEMITRWLKQWHTKWNAVAPYFDCHKQKLWVCGYLHHVLLMTMLLILYEWHNIAQMLTCCTDIIVFIVMYVRLISFEFSFINRKLKEKMSSNSIIPLEIWKLIQNYFIMITFSYLDESFNLIFVHYFSSCKADLIIVFDYSPPFIFCLKEHHPHLRF